MNIIWFDKPRVPDVGLSLVYSTVCLFKCSAVISGAGDATAKIAPVGHPPEAGAHARSSLHFVFAFNVSVSANFIAIRTRHVTVYVVRTYIAYRWMRPKGCLF